MKFIDRFILAIHSIKNNKSRSLLTIIIVFIVSFLILSIMMLSINFSINQNNAQIEYLNQHASTITITKIYKDDKDFVFMPFFIVNEEIDNIIGLSKKYDMIISNIKTNSYVEQHFSINRNLELDDPLSVVKNKIDVSYKSFYFAKGINDAITDGRAWSEEDVGTNNVWVTDKFIHDAFDNGLELSIGDEIWLHIHHIERWDDVYFYSKNFIIQGIIDKQKVMSEKRTSNVSDIYIDISYANSIYHPVVVGNRSIIIEYYPPKNNFNVNEVYNLTILFVEDLYDAMVIPETGTYRIFIISSFIDTLKFSRFLGFIIIVVSILLSISIMGVSIGSVANSIIISADNNKKFFGLLKAFGLKHKNLTSIVIIEGIIIIFLGICISTILLYIFLPVYEHLINHSIGIIYSYGIIQVNYQAEAFIPLYLPIITNVAFIIATIFFSRTSFNSLAKMDVISIIGEVS